MVMKLEDSGIIIIQANTHYRKYKEIYLCLTVLQIYIIIAIKMLSFTLNLIYQIQLCAVLFISKNFVNILTVITRAGMGVCFSQ